MKHIYVALALNVATGRDQLVGFIRNVQSESDWDIKIVPRDEIPGLLRSDTASGISGLVTSLQLDGDLAARLAAAPFPTVLFSAEESMFKKRKARISIVKTDNEEIGRMGARHFLSLGRFASYAFIHAHPVQDWSLERACAFHATLTAEHARVRVFPPRNSPAASGNPEELGRWLKALPQPAAVMVAYDQRAIEVVNACKVAGLNIPEQISILGVDDDALFCEHVVPSISSIRLNCEALGERAVRELKRLLRARKAGGIRILRISPSGLVERSSTKVTTPSAHLVERAKAYIRDRACDAIGVKDVAAHLGVSRRLLDLRFRTATGGTVRSEIERVKFVAVDRAIRRGETSPRKLAAQCGFRSAKYLLSRFRKRNGRTIRAAVLQRV